VRADDPEIAVDRAQTLDVHLAVRASRKVDQSVQGVVLVISEAAVVQATEALNACGLVAGEKETIPGPRDGGEILVKRVLHMAERAPIGKGEGNLVDGFSEAGIGHKNSR
jgi:hypothetical protein